MKYIDKKFRSSAALVFFASLCCFLWGGAYPSIKIGYELFNIQPSDIGGKLVFAGIRFTIAGILVLMYQVIFNGGSIKLSKVQLKKSVFLGIMQTTLQYIFFYIGMAYISGIRGAILNGTGTFFSIIIAHFIYKDDRLNFNKIIGCIIGFVGVIIVNMNGIGSLGGNITFLGDGFIILAALMFSISSIYSKHAMKYVKPVTLAGYQLLLGGIFLTFVGIISGGLLYNFNLKSISVLVILILISSFAFAIWNELLKYNKVSKVSVFNFLTPIFGSILSAIFLNESLFDLKNIISLVLVSFGIFIVYRDK